MSEQQKAKPSDNLARSARWSGAITLTVAIGNLAVVLWLTRLLDPADFGTPALGIAVLGFVLLFVQNGLPGAVIFRQEQDRARLSGLFWSNVALGALGSLLLWASSRPLAAFFGDERLQGVLAALTVMPVMAAAGSIYKSIHLRDLAYRHIAGAELSAFAAGAGTALYLAWAGYGYWALVGQLLAKYAAEYAWFGAAGLRHFRPSFHWDRQELRPHFRFALAQNGERLSMYFLANWDTLLIGKLLGAEVLGVYDVFKRLVARPTSLAGEWIDRFNFPVMARAQGDRPTLAVLYIGNLRLLGMVLAPFALFGFAFAAPLLAQLTAAPWAGQVVVFRLMILAFSINALLHPLDGLLAATGRIQRLGYANVVWLCLSIPVLYWGSRWGLQGVAAAQLGLALLVQYPLFRFLIHPELGISFAAYCMAPARAVLLAAAALLPAWGAYAGTAAVWEAGAGWAAAAVYGLATGLLLRKYFWIPGFGIRSNPPTHQG